MLQDFDQEAPGVPLSTLSDWKWDVSDAPSEGIWLTSEESIHLVVHQETGVQAWLHCLNLVTDATANSLARHFASLTDEPSPSGWTSPLQSGLDDGLAYYITPIEDGASLLDYVRGLSADKTVHDRIDLALQCVRAVTASCESPKWRLLARAESAVVKTSSDGNKHEVIFTSLVPVPTSVSWEKTAFQGLIDVLELILGEQRLSATLSKALCAPTELALKQKLMVIETALLTKAVGQDPPKITSIGSVDAIKPQGSVLHRLKSTAGSAATSYRSVAPARSDEIPALQSPKKGTSTAAVDNVPPRENPLKWVLGRTPRLPGARLSLSRMDLLLWLAAALSLVIAGIVLVEPAPIRRLLVTEVTDTLSSSDAMWGPRLADSLPSPIIKAPRKEAAITVGPPPSLAQAENAFQTALENPAAKQSVLVSAFKLLRLSPDHADAKRAVASLLKERVQKLLTGIGLTPLSYEDDVSANWDDLAQLGFADAALLAASELLEVNPEESAKRAREIAKDGRPSSLVFLGQLYARGVGLDRDFKRALALFREAANGGDSGAQYLVGECFYQGRGITKNVSTAVDYLKKAANGGDPRAMDLLGNCYYKGEGSLKKNARLAAQWFRKAADHGNIKSLTNLAVLELKGDIPDAGPKDAVQLLTRSAEAGHPYGTCLLALCFEEGRGVEKNLASARTFYRKAAKMGQPDAIKWCSDNDVEKSST